MSYSNGAFASAFFFELLINSVLEKFMSPQPLMIFIIQIKYVYNAAAWSVITPLSEQSIAEGGEPKAFPDFTKGRWIRRKPLFGFGDEY